AGHYLGSGAPGVVYLQNSGLGNTINPLLSLADKEVYSLPMLLLIGWRGEPDQKDEPQHVKQGRITPNLLDAMNVPWYELNKSNDYQLEVSKAFDQMRISQAPVALLVRKDTFSKANIKSEERQEYPLTREKGIQAIIDNLVPKDIIVSATGMISRELYEYRALRTGDHSNDFLTVGSMGHALSIAHGVGLARKNERVICLDGDGSVLMHMGSLAILGQQGPKNIVHVVLNNGAHDSVGGQFTVGFGINLVGIAQSCGYRQAVSVNSCEEIKKILSIWQDQPGPLFLEVRIARGSRKDLGRPATSPIENRDAFMRKLGLYG
ncbi:MAG: phosphonopyruvate decarboxylase, partial [Porticoccus sp.]|nr:phosphonopyruvate decarboxylase [Porticoccus sp.]